jgi:MarR family transcriptional regulator, organic hydroperoxide resistance regulator
MFERCLYFNINALTRKINKIWDQAFSELGFSPAHAYLLRLVLDSPGISQKEIAEELKLEKSTVTRFIDTLQQRGYLKRTRNGRVQIIQPTASAKKLQDQLNTKGDFLYRQMIKAIGRSDLVELVGQLRESSSKLNK